jgi:hypothetical protein
MNTTTTTISLAAEVGALLLELARREESLACDEASATPYWAPTPPTVIAHRGAAEALRARADALLSGFAA